IVTRATLRLRPAPAPATTLVASFATIEDAGRAVSAIVAVAVPSMLELLDRTTVRAVEAFAHVGLDDSVGALLVIQSDSADARGELDAIEAMCKDQGALLTVRSSDPAEADLLLRARRSAHYALKAMGTTLMDDVAVPPAMIPSMLRMLEEIGARNGVVIGTFGHAGEGNIHPTIVFDATVADSVAAAWHAFDEIMHAAIALGGTITGEHGVGVVKRPYLAHEMDLRLHAAVKRAIDPLGIFNPGKAL
ncbi:MAG: FAD-binding oxidoreductase, partial [Actinomycetota bacterium]